MNDGEEYYDTAFVYLFFKPLNAKNRLELLYAVRL